MSKGKYYITTAIAYTSGKPHIGNTYEAVLADSIARFKRKDGYDVAEGPGSRCDAAGLCGRRGRGGEGPVGSHGNLL